MVLMVWQVVVNVLVVVRFPKIHAYCDKYCPKISNSVSGSLVANKCLQFVLGIEQTSPKEMFTKLSVRTMKWYHRVTEAGPDFKNYFNEVLSFNYSRQISNNTTVLPKEGTKNSFILIQKLHNKFYSVLNVMIVAPSLT